MLKYNEITACMEPEETLFKGKNIFKPWKDAYYSDEKSFEDYKQFKPMVDKTLKYILGYNENFNLPSGCSNKIREYAASYSYGSVYLSIDLNKDFLKDKLSSGNFNYLSAKLKYIYSVIENGLSESNNDSEPHVSIKNIDFCEPSVIVQHAKPNADISKWLDEED